MISVIDYLSVIEQYNGPENEYNLYNVRKIISINTRNKFDISPSAELSFDFCGPS